MDSSSKKVVVGFWIRLLADIIDALILGIFGFILALPLKNIFLEFGENGLFIGLIITFLYTGILQSQIGHGQSLAKKLLKIQVLNIDGTYQNFRKLLCPTAYFLFIYDNQTEQFNASTKRVE